MGKPTSRAGFDCLFLRGTAGKWIQDWDYARRADYEIPADIFSPNTPNYYDAGVKFSPTDEQPFRWATSWRWEDEDCPVEEVDHESFCDACEKLNLTRFLIVGDSLSLQFMFSLLSLLGYPPSMDRTEWFTSRNAPFSIPCQKHNFVVSFWQYPIAVKPIGQMDPALDPKYHYSDALYRPFVEDNENRTAIVLNRGAWIYGFELFSELIQSDLEWLDSLSNTGRVLAFYKPSIPGHPGCEPTKTDSDFDWSVPLKQRPFHSYGEYESAVRTEIANGASHFNWMDFQEYNAHVQSLLSLRPSDRIPVHWINIFNSGVLRRDGHVGFNDCLHYYLPGPTDWWAHFFFSMLLDLSNAPDDGGLHYWRRK